LRTSPAVESSDEQGSHRVKSILSPLCVFIAQREHFLSNGDNDVLDLLSRDSVVGSAFLGLGNTVGNHFCFRFVFVVWSSD
jgi:hypothetical protein